MEHPEIKIIINQRYKVRQQLPAKNFTGILTTCVNA